MRKITRVGDVLAVPDLRRFEAFNAFRNSIRFPVSGVNPLFKKEFLRGDERVSSVLLVQQRLVIPMHDYDIVKEVGVGIRVLRGHMHYFLSATEGIGPYVFFVYNPNSLMRVVRVAYQAQGWFFAADKMSAEKRETEDIIVSLS